MYLGLVLPDPALQVQPIGLSMEQAEKDSKLIDYDVNWYGFLQSKEYQEIYNYVTNYLLNDLYDSPYFGLGNGAYRQLDSVYKLYKSNLSIGTMPVSFPDVKKVITTTSGISPALILAAAAAFFFAG